MLLQIMNAPANSSGWTGVRPLPLPILTRSQTLQAGPTIVVARCVTRRAIIGNKATCNFSLEATTILTLKEYVMKGRLHPTSTQTKSTHVREMTMAGNRNNHLERDIIKR
jgi:hypothetical protein